MRKFLQISFVAGAAAAALFSPTQVDAAVYDTSVGQTNLIGSRTYSANQYELDAGGNGINSSTFGSLTVSWNIGYTMGVTPWHYSYSVSWTPSNSLNNISHFILDLSDNCSTAGSNCVVNPVKVDGNGNASSASVSPGTYSVGGSNPGMAGAITGVKFNVEMGTPYTIEFDSARAPVWGDFYTKGGNANTSTGGWYAQNLGIDAPTKLTSNNVIDFIATPDTTSVLLCANGNPFPNCNNQIVETPEPMSLGVLGVGMIGLAAVRRKRKAA